MKTFALHDPWRMRRSASSAPPPAGTPGHAIPLRATLDPLPPGTPPEGRKMAFLRSLPQPLQDGGDLGTDRLREQAIVEPGVRHLGGHARLARHLQTGITLDASGPVVLRHLQGEGAVEEEQRLDVAGYG